jgi:uncharacterized protein YcbK (DUF882 family)
LYHTHTRERLDVVYRRGSDYVPEALVRVDRFLRDHRTGDVHHYDPRLLDLLSGLDRTHTTGIAKHSLHMQAEAIDIRLPGIKTVAVRDAALALHRGGVGYYAQSDFVHVDLGRVRRW